MATASPIQVPGDSATAARFSEATASMFKGVSRVAITSRPRAVVGSRHRRSAWNPTAKSTAVTPLNKPNFSQGRSAMLAQKLITSASEQPTIRRPPTTSPQRMFFSSRNADSSFVKGCAGGFGAWRGPLDGCLIGDRPCRGRSIGSLLSRFSKSRARAATLSTTSCAVTGSGMCAGWAAAGGARNSISCSGTAAVAGFSRFRGGVAKAGRWDGADAGAAAAAGGGDVPSITSISRSR